MAILGGGDGGALREVLNFHSVEVAHLVEMDERVINVSREYLPFLASNMANPKAVIHVEDAFQWVEMHTMDNTTTFDAVIVDLLDLTGSNNSVLNYLFEPNLASGNYDKLEDFVLDIRTIVGDTGAMTFQMGEEPMPTACSMMNPLLSQLEECAGLRRQYTLLQTLKKHFIFTHVYSVYVSSWKGLWSMALATSSNLIQERFNRKDANDIASDLQERTIRTCDNFGADTMLSTQIQPHIWTQVDDIMFEQDNDEEALQLEDNNSSSLLSSNEDKKLPLCPHIKQLAPNNNVHRGYTIPYRLGESRVAPSGVGVFTLKDVKRGDVIWRFHRESFLLFTEENWLLLLEGQARTRNWKGAPDLDASWESAVQKGWIPENLTSAVPEELIKQLLKRDWINDWPIALLPNEEQAQFFEEEGEEEEDKDEEDNMELQEYDEDQEELVMLYELDDAKYINNGHYKMKEKGFIRTMKYQNLPPDTMRDSIDSKVSIALKDIPACTELLENYWHDEGNLFMGEEDDEFPVWFREATCKYEGVNEYLDNPPYKFMSTSEANVGSF